MSPKRLLMLFAVVVLLLAATALAAYAATITVSHTVSNPALQANTFQVAFSGTVTSLGNDSLCLFWNGAVSNGSTCTVTGTSFTCPTRTGLTSGAYTYVVISRNANNCNGTTNQTGTSGTKTVTISPLAVTLANFTSARDGARVRLAWETVSETDNAGFKVYRSASETSERALLAFIPAQAIGGAAGATYEYTDAAAIDPNAVYWLEDIDLAGKATLHGPLAPAAQAPNAVSARSFTATPVTPNVPLYIVALFVMAGGLWGAVYGLGRKRA